MTLRYFAQLPPTAEHVAALQLLGRLGAVAAGSWPFALLPGAHPHASLQRLERAHSDPSAPTPAPGSSGVVAFGEAARRIRGERDDPKIARLVERMRQRFADTPPKLAWMRLAAALEMNPDLAGLPCGDCGAPAEWIQFTTTEPGKSDLLGLCQDHIGDHVP